MLGGVDTQGWSLSAGSGVANEVVNSALMSGFTITTSEVKPSELHILPICRGVGGSKGEQTLPTSLLAPNGRVATPSKYLGLKMCTPH